MAASAAEVKGQPLKTPEIMALLRERCSMENGYAMLENVANFVGSGSRSRKRYADALAMSQWGKSQALHGFEVKASRSDWLRELKDESKADSVYRYCDFWWVVVGDAAIVKEGELPQGWGLLAPRGGSLVALAQAEPQMHVVVHDRSFVAAIFRRAKEQQVDKRLIEQAAHDARERERELQTHLAESRQRRLEERVEELTKTIADFEAASGLKLTDRWWAGYGTDPSEIGRAVKLLLNGERKVDQITNTLHRLARDTDVIRSAIADALGRPAEPTP